MADRKSILDLVLEDAQDLQRRLGAKDRRKMGEYLESVREIEARIARNAKHPRKPPRRSTYRPASRRTLPSTSV